MYRTLRRVALLVFVVPHELGHAVPAHLAGLQYDVRLQPEWEGDGTPLGQFDAAVDDAVPLWLVRAVAVAPLPLYLGVALVVRETARPSGLPAVLTAGLCAVWASLSAGDLGIALAPVESRHAGSFVATVPRQTRRVADLLTLLTTAAAAVILLT